MRLLLDHHLSPDVAAALQAAGYDATTARALGLHQEEDSNVWRYAREHGLVVVTYNVRDFANLSAELASQQVDHPGLILIHPRSIPQYDRGAQIRALKQLLDSRIDLANQVVYLRAEG